MLDVAWRSILFGELLFVVYSLTISTKALMLMLDLGCPIILYNYEFVFSLLIISESSKTSKRSLKNLFEKNLVNKLQEN